MYIVNHDITPNASKTLQRRRELERARERCKLCALKAIVSYRGTCNDHVHMGTHWLATTTSFYSFLSKHRFWDCRKSVRPHLSSGTPPHPGYIHVCVYIYIYTYMYICIYTYYHYIFHIITYYIISLYDVPQPCPPALRHGHHPPTCRGRDKGGKKDSTLLFIESGSLEWQYLYLEA